MSVTTGSKDHTVKNEFRVVNKSSSFTPDINVYTYLIDTTSGDVTVNLPLSSPALLLKSKIWNFKKKVKANKIILSANEIDGQTSIDIKKQYTNLTVQFNDEKYIIL